LSNFKRGKKTGLPTGNSVAPSKVETSTQEEMGLIYKQECARYSHERERLQPPERTTFAYHPKNDHRTFGGAAVAGGLADGERE
ncbi:hypothetical protein AVEN_81863-1, partial [Araneus ventricosus]